MAGEAEVGLDQDASGAIDGSAEALAERGSGHAGGPENYGCGESRVSGVDRAGFNISDYGRGANFDAQAMELFLGAAGKILGVGWQNARATF
jgi:hypothetical protein